MVISICPMNFLKPPNACNAGVKGFPRAAGDGHFPSSFSYCGLPLACTSLAQESEASSCCLVGWLTRRNRDCVIVFPDRFRVMKRLILPRCDALKLAFAL